MSNMPYDGNTPLDNLSTGSAGSSASNLGNNNVGSLGGLIYLSEKSGSQLYTTEQQGKTRTEAQMTENNRKAEEQTINLVSNTFLQRKETSNSKNEKGQDGYEKELSGDGLNTKYYKNSFFRGEATKKI